MKLNTRDIGLAIRDHLEGNEVYHYDQRGDGELYQDDSYTVEAVDVSDAHNPIVYLCNGQVFNVRIFVSAASS
jgi:DNA-directed RNA polymerase alpha subunit